MATLAISAGLKAVGGKFLLNTALSVGLGLVQRALTPDQVVKQQGPRLSESQITGSTEGAPIPRIGGAVRVGGQLIWTTTFRETIVETSETRGGKGGPKAITQSTEYVYDCSFAIALCEADGDVALRTIWIDGKEADLSELTYRFYDGSQVDPDPKIQAVEGNDTPAFKGVCYVVFEDLELTEYGNRIPQVTVEVRHNDVLLSQILLRECRRVGYTVEDIDVSDIAVNDVTITGVLIGSLTSPRAVLQNLMTAYYLVAEEYNGTIVFTYRKDFQTKFVELDDFIAADEAYTRTKIQDEDLPDRTQVDFLDPSRNYATASVDGHTVTGNSYAVTSFSSIATLTDDYARALADILTHEAWVGRYTLAFSVPFGSESSGREYLSLRPGTVFEFEGLLYRVVSRAIGDQIDVTAVTFAPDIYTPVSHLSGLVLASLLSTFGPTEAVFADLPLAVADEPAPYSPRVVVYQSPFPAAVTIYRSDGSGGFDVNTNVTARGVIGETTTDFARGAPWVWDRANSVTVRLSDPSATLTSAPELSVLNGANTLAVKTPSGEWEVFQFATAVLNGDGTYTLSDLLRGQLGTEPYIGDPTPTGSTVILYDTGRWGTLNGSLGMIGQDLSLRYGPSSLPIGDDAFQDEIVTPGGVAYRPYAPTSLRQKQQANGDIVLSWKRRTRLGGDSWATEDAPLNEDQERYRVTITGGRTVDVLNATELTYTVANQIDDLGASVDTVNWSVGQVSAVFGIGSIANE